jgi:hypothetical protein
MVWEKVTALSKRRVVAAGDALLGGGGVLLASLFNKLEVRALDLLDLGCLAGPFGGLLLELKANSLFLLLVVVAR